MPPNASLEAVFERGNEVGELACELFKGGERIEWEITSFDEKIAQTKELIERGVRYIYEATFSFGGALIMVDILEVCADGSFVINEVKSSTSVSTVYMDDMSGTGTVIAFPQRKIFSGFPVCRSLIPENLAAALHQVKDFTVLLHHGGVTGIRFKAAQPDDPARIAVEQDFDAVPRHQNGIRRIVPCPKYNVAPS